METLIIKGDLPTMNEIVDAAKKETFKYRPYAEMKRAYTDLVAWTTLSQLKGVKFERVDLKITWFCKNKKKDPDNIMAGQKFIIDGLVSAGLIPNDGWKNINSITHCFEIDSNNPRVEVNITAA